ncbi:HlyD family efflux transporter periplasmic adaptor subunit [Stenotrophomonas indicatrix]|uniref:HlyD family secretion protein n=1 Tax=Stenotrophomonas indicatrix TaxID=2045451 RepID=UPI00300A5B22
MSDILAEQGSHVEAGGSLALLTSGRGISTAGEEYSQLDEQLGKKKVTLVAELSLTKESLKSRTKRLLEERRLLLRRADQASEQIKIQQKRVESAHDLYQRWQRGGELGVISAAQVLQQHDVFLQEMATLEELRGELLSRRQAVGQLASQIEQLSSSSAADVMAIEKQLADTEQDVIRNASIGNPAIRSSVTGTVTNVLVKIGQFVPEGAPIATIVPAGSQLLAELWVPSAEIGLIESGDQVGIRYQAFPYQKFGSATGIVESVSTSPVPAAELTKILGYEVKEASYRVSVRLPSQFIEGAQKKHLLRPGMKLDADVLLETRTLLEWLFEPILESTRR